MKEAIPFILAIFLFLPSFAQSTREEREVVQEALKLYRSEMASWHGTDLFIQHFPDKQPGAGGYFSYPEGDRTICVFYSNAEQPNVLVSFSFDSTYNPETVVIDDMERPLSEKEADLLAIRMATLEKMKTDTLYRFYENMHPNLIPIIDEKGRRVYVLTGPEEGGIIVFGNDYLLTFDKNNNLKAQKRLHQNIITIPYGTQESSVLGTMHTHAPESGRIISATDICTLMLYAGFAQWEKHYVLSDKNVSVWDCKNNELTVMTRKAWDKVFPNRN